MVSVDYLENQVRDYLTNQRDNTRKLDLHIICISSPQNVTMAGAEESINLIISDLDTQGVSAHEKKTRMAYHSPSMRAIADGSISHILKRTLQGDHSRSRWYPRSPAKRFK